MIFHEKSGLFSTQANHTSAFAQDNHHTLVGRSVFCIFSILTRQNVKNIVLKGQDLMKWANFAPSSRTILIEKRVGFCGGFCFCFFPLSLTAGQWRMQWLLVQSGSPTALIHAKTPAVLCITAFVPSVQTSTGWKQKIYYFGNNFNSVDSIKGSQGLSQGFTNHTENHCLRLR